MGKRPRAEYDQYAKDTLCALLTPAGPVKTEQEVSTDAQRVDLYFVPDAARASGAPGPAGGVSLQPGACAVAELRWLPTDALEVQVGAADHATLSLGGAGGPG